MKSRYFLYSVTYIFLTSCATSQDVDSLESSIAKIERAVLEVARHQRVIDDQIAALYTESENEFSNVREKLAAIKRKTDGLDFIPNESGSVVVPSNRESKNSAGRVVLALSRTSFWRSSGGRNPTHSGNHFYYLDVETGGDAVIDLFSSASPPVDTYLYLLSESDVQIEADDDDGSGKYAQIKRALPPGRYKIVAATYKSGINASYVLNISGIRGRLVNP